MCTSTCLYKYVLLLHRIELFTFSVDIYYIQEVINIFHGIYVFYYVPGEGIIITIIIFIFKSYNKSAHYILPVPRVNKTTDRTSVLVYATVFILGSLKVDFVHI